MHYGTEHVSNYMKVKNSVGQTTKSGYLVASVFFENALLIDNNIDTTSINHADAKIKASEKEAFRLPSVTELQNIFHNRNKGQLKKLFTDAKNHTKKSKLSLDFWSLESMRKKPHIARIVEFTKGQEEFLSKKETSFALLVKQVSLEELANDI